MTKKNDSELMNDFNLKYSHLNFDEFLLRIGDDYNDSKFTRLFKSILNQGNFKGKGFDSLIKMKSAIHIFKPKDDSLKSVLLSQLELIQAELDNLLD